MFEIMPGFGQKNCKAAYIRDLIVRAKHLASSITQDYIDKKDSSNPIWLFEDAFAKFSKKPADFHEPVLECYKEYLSYNDKIENEILDDIEKAVYNTIEAAGASYDKIRRKIEETGQPELKLIIYYYDTLASGTLKVGSHKFFSIIESESDPCEINLIENITISISDYLEIYTETIKAFLGFGSEATKPIIEVMIDIIKVNISILYKYIDYLYGERPWNKELLIVLIGILGYLLRIVEVYVSLYNKSLIFACIDQDILDNCMYLFSGLINRFRNKYESTHDLNVTLGIMMSDLRYHESIKQGLVAIMS